jgi:hypothetical protein
MRYFTFALLHAIVEICIEHGIIYLAAVRQFVGQGASAGK